MPLRPGDVCATCGHRRDRHSSGGMCAGELDGSECYCVRFPDAPDFATVEGDAADIASLVRDRDCYDKSSGTYAIPIEAFDALAEVAGAAGAIMAQLELEDDPVWDDNPDYDRLALALARLAPRESHSHDISEAS